METLIVVGCIVGAVDFLTNLTKIGNADSRNAVIKVALAFLACLGILAWAGQTSIAGDFSLHGIIPAVAGDSILKNLGFADLAFASMFFAFNGSVLVSFRKAFDNSQSAAMPSLTRSNTL